MRKAAAKAVHTLVQDYAQHRDQQRLLRELSTLLRRIALSYHPREQVAGITGEAWPSTLNRLTNEPVLDPRSQQLLNVGPYQATLTDDIGPLLEQVQKWISLLPAHVKERAC